MRISYVIRLRNDVIFLGTPCIYRGVLCDTGRPSVRPSLRPSVPVCTLTPKVFNFHVSYLVHRYRLWRRCVATYVRHLKWLPWQPGCCFPCCSNSVYTFLLNNLAHKYIIMRRCVAYMTHVIYFKVKVTQID